MSDIRLIHGDCLDVLRTLADASVDAVVTDPPYNLSFMGREWDTFPIRKRGQGGTGINSEHAGGVEFKMSRENSHGFQAWCELWAAECLRVLKPGGHLLAFGGSRTYHRLTCAVEDSGFEIRDCITWHFGSGFPKSLNVTDALGRIVPADARCVCGPRSTETAPDSRAGYPSSHGSDGEPPQSATGSGQGSAPSPADALGRTRDDLRAGDLASAPASTGLDGGSVHPSTEGSPRQAAPLEGVFPIAAAARSDKRTSTSVAPEPAPRRTADRTPHTSGLAAGSASSSSLRNKHMACPVCGGIAIPQGLGTALKPASEFIVVARKPLTGTVSANVLTHGTGALNVDACRIEHASEADLATSLSKNPGRSDSVTSGVYGADRPQQRVNTAGRWPANVVLDESQAEVLDEQSGTLTSGLMRAGTKPKGERETYGQDAAGGYETASDTPGDSGGASRFFYVAKADASERVRYYRPTCECEDAWPTTTSPAKATDVTTTAGSSSTSRSGSDTTDNPSLRATRSTTSTATSSTTTPATSSQSPQPITSASTPAASSETANGGSPAASASPSSQSALLTGISAAKGGPSTVGAAPATSRAWSATSVCGSCGAPTRREAHATVKPLALMRWLVRLVTPPGGTVLEPFAGSGTTVEACILEGFDCIAIEREADYLPLIQQRIDRRRDPVAAVLATGDDGGLFDLLDGGAA